jgi:hypothetical protein
MEPHCKKGYLFPARKSLVSGIPAWDGKFANLFLQCMVFLTYSGSMDAGLSRLDVSGNQVASLASLPHLPDLEYLDLSRDQFIRY